jgi:hypothetical protein
MNSIWCSVLALWVKQGTILGAFAKAELGFSD